MNRNAPREDPPDTPDDLRAEITRLRLALAEARAHEAARTLELQQAHFALAEEIAERRRAEATQAALYQISESTHGTEDLDALFARIHAIVGGLLPANNFYIALYDEAIDEITYPYFVDDRDPPPAPRKRGRGLTDRMLGSKEPLLLSRADMRTLVDDGQLVVRGTPPIDWLGVPLIASRGLIGVLAVETYSDAVRYAEKDKALLQFVSNQVAAAIERTRDALARARASEALLEQSLTDPLTGLRNRRFLGTRMPEDIAQVERSQREVALDRIDRMKLNIDLLFVMIDLDAFKHVNDRHGHAAGDRVLQQMGDILRVAARATDTLVRWGGEEFLVVGRHAARADAHHLPERIRAAVEAHEFDLGNGKTLRCTCSIGFSLYPLRAPGAAPVTWEHCIKLADDCLYLAKHNGRNAWVGIDPAMDGGAPDGAALSPHSLAGAEGMGYPLITSLVPATPA
jgi:diguanylate cyclase (GGDEF)-like protein